MPCFVLKTRPPIFWSAALSPPFFFHTLYDESCCFLFLIFIFTAGLNLPLNCPIFRQRSFARFFRVSMDGELCPHVSLPVFFLAEIFFSFLSFELQRPLPTRFPSFFPYKTPPLPQFPPLLFSCPTLLLVDSLHWRLTQKHF